jgi:hypothetical protein
MATLREIGGGLKAAVSTETSMLWGFRSDTHDYLQAVLGRALATPVRDLLVLEGPGVRESRLVTVLREVFGVGTDTSPALEISHRDLLPERRDQLMLVLRDKRLLLVDFRDQHLDAYIPVLTELVEPRIELGLGRYQPNFLTVVICADRFPTSTLRERLPDWGRFTEALAIVEYWPDGWGDMAVMLDVLSMTTEAEGTSLGVDLAARARNGDEKALRWVVLLSEQNGLLDGPDATAFSEFLKHMACGRQPAWAPYLDRLGRALSETRKYHDGEPQEATEYFARRPAPTEKPRRDRTVAETAAPRSKQKRQNDTQSQLPGVYAYSYPSTMVPDGDGRFLIKVGRSVDVDNRVATQARRTEMPEDVVHLRTYPSVTPVELEDRVQAELKKRKRHHKTTHGGTEWFRTSLDELDSILESFGVLPSLVYEE